MVMLHKLLLNKGNVIRHLQKFPYLCGREYMYNCMASLALTCIHLPILDMLQCAQLLETTTTVLQLNVLRMSQQKIS